MDDDKVGREAACGWAMAVGAVAAVVAMAMHPSGRQLLQADDRAAVVLRDQLVHGTAITALGSQVFGALGLVRRLRSPAHGLAAAGFVAFTFAAVAGMLAAVASGFVAPLLLDGLAATDAAARAAAEALWRGSGHVNQAFARFYVCGSGAALVLWSLAAWRRGWPRALAGFGLVAGVAATMAVASGLLRLDVHGMGAVVLAQAIWFVAAGRRLLRGR